MAEMKKVFLSNITFHAWAESINEQINIFRQFDIDGIEVAFKRLKDLAGLTRENKEFLNSFGFNTMHAPFKERYDSEEIFDKIKKVAKEINAKNIVFHPQESLKGKDFNICIENQKRKEPLTEELLDKNKKFTLCLDVSHTNTTGETEKLLKRYFNRISEIHFSANSEDKRHVPLVNAEEGFFDNLSEIKKLDVPFVLEARYPPNNTELIKKDIEFTRKWLNS
jgi:sugar phosphate isomerase/epimerase